MRQAWIRSIERTRSTGDLAKVVARFTMALAPVGYKRILSMSWDEAAVDAANCGNGQLSELLTIASQAWHDITDADHETDAGCNCHVMRGETCTSCMRKFAAEQGVTWQNEVLKRGERQGYWDEVSRPLTDPDGAPHGAFLNQNKREMGDAAVAKIERRRAWTASLAHIHQPAKSLREELRLGADVYEDR